MERRVHLPVIELKTIKLQTLRKESICIDGTSHVAHVRHSYDGNPNASTRLPLRPRLWQLSLCYCICTRNFAYDFILRGPCTSSLLGSEPLALIMLHTRVMTYRPLYRVGGSWHSVGVHAGCYHRQDQYHEVQNMSVEAIERFISITFARRWDCWLQPSRRGHILHFLYLWCS